MFSLTICFGPNGANVPLLFKTLDRAVEQRDEAINRPIMAAFTDDFGQEFMVRVEQIHAMLLEDLDQSQLGQIERGLHNARTQAKANQRGMSDPVIKQAAMMQGPAVLSSVPNGRFNG